MSPSGHCWLYHSGNITFLPSDSNLLNPQAPDFQMSRSHLTIWYGTTLITSVMAAKARPNFVTWKLRKLSLDSNAHDFITKGIVTHWCRDKIADILQAIFSSMKTIFHQWKCSYFDQISFEFVRKGRNWQHANTGSDNDLPPNRRHTITWTNDGLAY